jgi:hypothetical protein
MTPEEILDERNKMTEFKKEMREYPLTPDECFKGINLKETLDKILTIRDWSIFPNLEGVIIQAMKEACDQTVDLCAENALTKMEGERLVYGPPPTWWAVIDKESILKTKEQIK